MRNPILFFDKAKRRLVFAGTNATAAFWDEHWSDRGFERQLMSKNRFVNHWTSRYLTTGSRILEGGCGRGQNVWSLSEQGFDGYGVDYATETVKLINRFAPNLKVLPADVRHLPFPDGFFDGYRSLGVIEHFYEGFSEIIDEAARVIQPGGYLFLTFPHMSALRRLKATFGYYQELPEGFEPESHGFYQFALVTSDVMKSLEKLGFELVHKSAIDGVKGLKDEVSSLKPTLQRIYDSPKLRTRVLKRLIDTGTWFWAGHMAFLILKRTSDR